MDFAGTAKFIRKPEKLIMEGLAWYSKLEPYYDEVIRKLWVMFPEHNDSSMLWRQTLFSSICQLEASYTCSGWPSDEAFEYNESLSKEAKFYDGTYSIPEREKGQWANYPTLRFALDDGDHITGHPVQGHYTG